MIKKWLIAKKIPEEYKNQFAEVNPIVLQLLFNRGLTTQTDIDEFLNPDYGQDLHDPFIFRDMNKAVERIFQAVTKNEKITVHGDYDADGVCSTAIVVSALKGLGAEVDVYIPHRVSEGYGLNMNTVAELHKNKTNLIVTVDCGITSKEEIDLAKQNGMDVIVTDHHEQPPELPAALAIINPHVEGENYPFKDLSGSGVAFKLVQALVQKDKGQRIKDGFEKWLLDLVAMGTIGDCVPLVGENRTLTRYGLVVLRKTRRLGLQELAQTARLNLATLDTMNVSFGIVPRLNAAGRLDHANTAYELLMTKDQKTAKQVAEDIQKTNQERQKITEKILKASIEQIGVVDKQKILFAIGKDWTLGVVGLVAGRLMDKYARPVIIMGEKEKEIVGSGRSIHKFDITKALIESRKLLVKYGGHALACGFTIKTDKFKDFIKKMTSLAAKEIKKEDMVNKFLIDGEVALEDVNWELTNALEDFEPFGVGNHQPRFVTYGIEIIDFQKIGVGGKHLRLMVRQGQETKKIIAFGFGNGLGNQLKIGDRADIVYEVSVNEWNGNRELQLKLIDLKISN